MVQSKERNISLLVFKGDFVYGEFKEQYDFRRTQEYIKESANLCYRNYWNTVMNDRSGVTGKISTWDRFKLAQAFLNHFGRNLQKVVVYREEEITGFFEDVVVNRGGNFRIFTQLKTACDWLGIDQSVVVVK
jgi:hypothetical protein